MSFGSQAWMLDVMAFHHEFDDLVGSGAGTDPLVELRARAVELWHATDPIARSYVGALHTAGPDEWEASLDERHAVDWYRVLMAPYLIPTRAFRAPLLLKRRLPDLGWPPSEARRLALGRELQLLAEAHAAPASLRVLLPHFTLGHKGWLGQDDVDAALGRFRALDPRVFRDHQELVEVAENAYEVLEAAATKPDHVLVLLAD